ncbi:Peptidase A1 [Macleaya cordata]|uniref:Peptidase A1 n=1 Tax=Macleaya cordata TaxID=56857 RepID=A0A200QFC8_MACCD|nr:Peptidase A1 [Macleaya cordata]
MVGIDTHKTGRWCIDTHFGGIDTHFQEDPVSIPIKGVELIVLLSECLPCELCYKHNPPIFDPTKSSSYTKIGCEEKLCKLLPTVRCDKNDGTSCYYGIVYASLTSSEGILSTETFVFQHDGHSGNISILELAFGCGHKNKDPFGGSEHDDGPPGVIGLNRNALSLISQLAFDSFSHCFVAKNNTSQSSLIHFGLDAVITEGSTTPMLDQGSSGYYYLSLEGISIGKDRFNILPGSLNITRTGEGGFILDTGMTYTMINENAHKCKLEDIQTTPDVTFHFTGLDLVLTKLNTWIDAGDGNVCLAMLEGLTDHSILGNQQLQNVNVGYDLKKKVVSFKDMDCNNT